MIYHLQDDPAKAYRLISKLRMRDLQLLLALESGTSLRSAAQEMNLTQPALSIALREIEEIFKAKLFIRSQQGVTPTSQGVLAIRRAREMLDLLALTQVEIQANASIRPIVRLGMPPFVAYGYMPLLMSNLIQDEAPVRMEIMEGPVHELFSALVDGRVDGLITTYAGIVPESPACELTYDHLFECRFSFIAPLNHPLANEKAVSLQQLVHDRWTMPSKTSLLRSALTAAFQRAGASPPTPIVESNNPVTHVRMVAAGVGISCVPSSTINDVLGSLVAELHVQPALAESPVALVYRTSDRNPAISMIREFLASLNHLVVNDIQ